MLDVFGRELSGDYNPLHMSEEYASSTSFKKRVCPVECFWPHFSPE